MSKTLNRKVDDVVIRFSGDSGDGMQLTGTLFSDASALAGNGVSTFPDYPAEIRAPQGTVAGVSGFQVHVGSAQVATPGDHCDTLVAMNPAALKANACWVKPGATILLDADEFNEKSVEKAGFKTADPITELNLQDRNVIMAPITSMTRDAVAELGLAPKTATKCKNMFALGVCFHLYNRPMESTLHYFDKKFGKKDPGVAAANKLALKAGYNYAANTHALADTYDIPAADLPKGTYRNINGNQAVAWGFMAASEKSGRPLFCGSYPITPATSILEALAKRKDMDVKTLQAEDEIAGICTSIGAAFAGDLAVTTTSGPGLSLKSEAMGLAVMAELPLVIVDVQRGGPSTGLPTKTEQSDLAQALWGRNGECPMPVIAASTPADCFDYAFTAAKIALEHMTPVMLLTDGFIANGTQPWRIPRMADYPRINPPIVTKVPEGGYVPYKRDPKRLARTWALPGTKGMEHRIGGLEKDFIKGSVSHDPLNHQRMVDVRAEKVARIREFIPRQRVFGRQRGELLVVGWGGTYGHLRTAVEQMQGEGKSVSLCNINYINPLPKGLEEIFCRFKKIVVCELNSGQLARHLRAEFQQYEYLQYNKVQGLPFTVEELTARFNEILSSK
ncbi:MAG: 2-oxoacid:acceptor oxidoreductase subunit alpha [Rikenellaceae bacterium]|jgi:2-oxoglutarate ferredoxin oxidoreductase subunit alpha|nr:2-oxoacid:acceptor oxidoreductase subunit alpha [Rikenellaceae bacterium]